MVDRLILGKGDREGLKAIAGAMVYDRPLVIGFFDNRL